MEDVGGNIGVGEREFIISPNYSCAVMSALEGMQLQETRIKQTKKPFDWMTDDQFYSLQVFALFTIGLLYYDSNYIDYEQSICMSNLRQLSMWMVLLMPFFCRRCIYCRWS